MQRMMDKMSVEATLKQMGKLVKPAFVHELNAALNQIKRRGERRTCKAVPQLH